MLKATARKKPIAPPPKPLLAIFPLLFIRHWLLPTSSIFYFQIFTKNPLVASSFLPYKEVFMRHFLQRAFSAFQNVELLASHLKKNEQSLINSITCKYKSLILERNWLSRVNCSIYIDTGANMYVNII